MPYADPERQRAFKREWRQKNAYKIALQKREYRRKEQAIDRQNRAGLRNKANKANKPTASSLERTERTEPLPVSLPALRIPTLDEIIAKYGK